MTNALPAHVQHMGGVRGVLITTFALAVWLAATLRVNIALLGQTRLALTGQDERLATIAEQFQQMQADLSEKER